MQLPEMIAGLDPRRVREMFRNFNAQDTEMDWNNGAPIVKIRRMTVDFIGGQLDIEHRQALRIQEALVAEGWITPEKFVPTRSGMALAQHVDRPNLPRAEAEALLGLVLDWADRINAVAHARVKVIPFPRKTDRS